VREREREREKKVSEKDGKMTWMYGGCREYDMVVFGGANFFFLFFNF
jgi:hypothetical protein